MKVESIVFVDELDVVMRVKENVFNIKTKRVVNHFLIWKKLWQIHFGEKRPEFFRMLI